MIDKLKSKIASLKEKAGYFSVLYVEDEAELREGIRSFLSKIFTDLDTAQNGKEGFEKYILKKYDIVLTDIQMPKMNGLEMIKKIREIDETQEIIVISAYTDAEYLTESIQLNVTGYIIKPIEFMQILQMLEQSVYKLSALRENEIYKEKLESMVEERTKTVLDLQRQQLLNYNHAIHSLVKMIEARDTYTGGHSERVALYSKKIAKAMKLSEQECNMIYESGILHDIGKIITPDAILLKPNRLTKDEYSLIKEHATAGYNILSEIPMYRELADIVHAHHEHCDGSGYPRGLKTEDIPLAARIMSVADAFDAMTTSRIYKTKKTIAQAIEELRKYSGTWYDTDVVNSAIDIFKSVNLDTHTQQTPISHMDDERFAYFYKDPLTHTYNHYYLDYILQNYNSKKSSLCLNVIYIKNFTSYNKKYGWSEGDILLNKFSNYLKSEFSNFQIFRIFGDDFALLCDKRFSVDIDKINDISLLKENDLHCEINQYDLDKNDIHDYKDLQP
ncbi:HD domain-containing phosphohydrolase [Sulfurimonas sp.]|uniref:HD domain-containing phosphohydrolase n=1 Tax=Sulfurimonas sp. TaxID=2022749 RepID=UPI0035698608